MNMFNSSIGHTKKERRLMSENEFRPNWASPPGDTILNLLDDKNITPSELAAYLQISFRETRDLLDGTFKITDKIAEKLAEFLGGSKQFWVNREAQYRETLERLKNETLCKK
jgi:plasmid maintenance system antidote protein VapI